MSRQKSYRFLILSLIVLFSLPASLRCHQKTVGPNQTSAQASFEKRLAVAISAGDEELIKLIRQEYCSFLNRNGIASAAVQGRLWDKMVSASRSKIRVQKICCLAIGGGLSVAGAVTAFYGWKRGWFRGKEPIEPNIHSNEFEDRVYLKVPSGEGRTDDTDYRVMIGPVARVGGSPVFF